MTNQQTLRRKLLDLDNSNYKAYRDIQGSYEFPDFTLIIDYIQGDPFAAPSKLRVQVPYTISSFPPELYKTPIREIALRDFLTRKFDKMAYEISTRRGTGNSGMIAITKMGQEVLERTSVYLIKLAPPTPKAVPGSNPALERAKPIKLSSQKGVEVRLIVGLPAGGRRILGRQAA
ncbi:MAG: ABC-ATPase domain-containing protein, partial [Trichodesmium sp. MAG_R04]|nr:ABC-ATPase domain-containing protein [Trichodesmium sp. MAG_R04]